MDIEFLLRYLDPKDTCLYINEVKNQNFPFWVYDDYTTNLNLLVNELKQNRENISYLVCSDNAKWLEEINAYCNAQIPDWNNKSKLYTKKHYNAEEMKDVNTHWEKKCILISPKVLCGISYTKTPVIVFGFYYKCSIKA